MRAGARGGKGEQGHPGDCCGRCSLASPRGPGCTRHPGVYYARQNPSRAGARERSPPAVPKRRRWPVFPNHQPMIQKNHALCSHDVCRPLSRPNVVGAKCYHCKPNFGCAVISASSLPRRSWAYAVGERYDLSAAMVYGLHKEVALKETLMELLALGWVRLIVIVLVVVSLFRWQIPGTL